MRRATPCAVLCALALVAGCSAFAPADDTPATALLLDQVPARVPHVPVRAALLRIEAPTARPVYDTTQMAYTLRAHQVAWYGRNQWAETPAQMIQPLLVRTLQASGAFGAVRTGADAQASFTLHTEITELLQDYTQEPPRARVALHVRLTDASGRTVGERDVVEEESMQAKGPYAGVLAANSAMARALGGVTEFVLQALP